MALRFASTLRFVFLAPSRFLLTGFKMGLPVAAGAGRLRFYQSDTPEGARLLRCILYIVRRTQLYLEENLWKTLHSEARREGTTVSDLVRRAVRDRYPADREKRRKAMMAWVGVWKDRDDLPETEQYVRHLRDDDRLERLKERGKK
jgi:hypothetical protein